ncbi:MAG: chromosomal replication initiator protein DnaA, partial [Oscillospiraceae bacterium]|nr:chromosomal replication initiator protein DnaA [Oscillospiraceae bacterium]
MNTLQDTFVQIKNYCSTSGRISPVAQNLWINSLEPVCMKGSSACFNVASEFQRSTIMANYDRLLKDAFTHILGINDVSIDFNVMENTENDLSYEQMEKMHSELEKKFGNAEYEHTFDTFIVGKSNEFAHAACVSVAEGKKYNPLFVYGASGLGKTHLLSAIAYEMRRRNPGLNIVYVTGEVFSSELIDAIKLKKDTSEFHGKYRNAEVLLVDDVQFIAGRETTQEEFFHTFNKLHGENRQIVLTSDKPPKDIATLADRIRSRFEGGLIADISLPDFETRVAIVKRKAELLQLDLPREICEFFANRLKTNIRQLEGAVKKLKAFNHLAGTPPSLTMAQNVIRDILTDDQTVPITVDKVIRQVANVYSVSAEDICSNKRT